MKSLPMSPSSSINPKDLHDLSFSLKDSFFYFEDLMGHLSQDPLVITVNEMLNPSFEVLHLQNMQVNNAPLQLYDELRESQIRQLLESIDAFQTSDFDEV